MKQQEKQKFDIHLLEEKVNYDGKYQIRVILILILYVITISAQFNQIGNLYQSPTLVCMNSSKQCTEQKNGCSALNIETTILKNKKNISNLTMQYQLYCDRRGLRYAGSMLPYLFAIIIGVMMACRSFHRKSQIIYISVICLVLSLLYTTVFTNIYWIIILMSIQTALNNQFFVPAILISNEQISEKCMVKYAVIMYMGFTMGLTYFSIIQYFFHDNWKLACLFNTILPNIMCILCTHFLIVESPSYVAQFNQKESLELLNYIAKVNGSELLNADDYTYNLDCNVQFAIGDLFRHKKMHFQLIMQVLIVFLSQVQYYMIIGSFQYIKIDYFLQRFSYQIVEYLSCTFIFLYTDNENIHRHTTIHVSCFAFLAIIYVSLCALKVKQQYYFFIINVLARFGSVAASNLGLSFMQLIFPIQLRQQSVAISSCFIASAFFCCFMLGDIQDAFQIYPKTIQVGLLFITLIVLRFYDLEQFKQINHEVEKEIENTNQLLMYEHKAYMHIKVEPDLSQISYQQQSRNEHSRQQIVDQLSQNN